MSLPQLALQNEPLSYYASIVQVDVAKANKRSHLDV